MLFEDSFLSVNGRDQVQYWIYVPASLVDRYKEAVIWNKMKNHILSW